MCGTCWGGPFRRLRVAAPELRFSGPCEPLWFTQPPSVGWGQVQCVRDLTFRDQAVESGDIFHGHGCSGPGVEWVGPGMAPSPPECPPPQSDLPSVPTVLEGESVEQGDLQIPEHSVGLSPGTQSRAEAAGAPGR